MFSEKDIASLAGFRHILDDTFKINLAKGNTQPALTDQALSSFITLVENKPLIIDFKKPVKINRAIFQENIATGQRAEKVLFEYWDGKEWKMISDFTTIGYKRLLRFDTKNLSKIRVTVLRSKEPVQLAELGLFYAQSE